MPIVFKPKLQAKIFLSTLEAKYIALSQSMRELLPLRRLLINEEFCYILIFGGVSCISNKEISSLIFFF